MRSINKIIIHCADTPKGINFNASDIDRWHKERGWNGIGYHFVILLDGTIQLGRNVKKQGAHTKGHNKNSIGICYIGGGNGEDTRTIEQKNALFCLIQDLLIEYPKATIHGHNEFSKKTCPNFNAFNEYNWLCI